MKGMSGFGRLRERANRRFVDLMTRYYRSVPLPPSFSNIPRDTPAAVIFRHRSLLMHALVRSFCERSGFDGVREIANTAAEAPPGTVFLADVLHPESLERLHREYPSIRFVTLNLFSGRGPIRHQPGYRMRFIDWVVLWTAPLIGKVLLVTFGRPIALPADASALRIARTLKVDFYRNLKLVRGTPFQPHQTQMRIVLGGKRLEQSLRELAEDLKISERRMQKRARRAFRQLAARPRTMFYFPASLVARFLVNKLFTEVITRGLDRFEEAVRKDTVVLVPMHRSHMDYVLLGHILYGSNLNPPLVAAGINLAFWPAGFFIRRVGGYFVKRDSRDPVHSLVLKRYVTYLISRGHLQEFFIEGGRSRSGKMRPPKHGLLNIFISAYFKGIRRDIRFVPVSIMYEHVVEDRAYGEENTGREKERESLRALLRVPKVFGNKYGEVIVQFGDAIPVSEWVRRQEAEGASLSGGSRKVVSALARDLVHRIRSQSSVTLTGLAYTALMTSVRYGMTARELRAAIERLAFMSELFGAESGTRTEFSPSLERFLRLGGGLPAHFSRSGVVREFSYCGQEVYAVPGNRRFTAQFYKNSTIHLFIPFSLLAMSELLEGHVDIEMCEQLHRLFREEQQLQPWSEYRSLLTALVERLLAEAVLSADSDGRIRYSKREQGIFLPDLLSNCVQAELWILRHLRPLKDISPDSETGVPLASFLTQLQREAEAGKYLGLLRATEAASKSLLASQMESLEREGVIAILQYGGQKHVRLLRFPGDEFQLLQRLDRRIRCWQAEGQGMGDQGLLEEREDFE